MAGKGIFGGKKERFILKKKRDNRNKAMQLNPFPNKAFAFFQICLRTAISEVKQMKRHSLIWPKHCGKRGKCWQAAFSLFLQCHNPSFIGL